MEIRLPRLGEGADSGTVASIFVKEGETVKKDQPILELESEKAVASIPSPSAGVVGHLHVKEGDLVKVGQLIMTLTTNGEQPSPVAETPAAPVAAATAQPAPQQSAAPVTAPSPHTFTPVPGIPPPASPTVRKMARDLGIDLSRVPGSEHGGRIVLADLKAYIQQLQSSVAQAQSAPSRPGAPATPTLPVDFSRWGTVQRKKMTTLRKTISDRMVNAWTTIPHIYQFDDADITDLLALKKKYDAKYEKQGAHLTLTAFAIKALVPTLKKHPLFNSSMDEAAGELVLKEYIHIGIAVDTEHGLIVPVLRNADKKSMLEIAVELESLAERGRARKLTLEEMQGGSFSISNQGGIGSGHFTPIINKPEVAILGIGRGAVKAVVREKKIEMRTLLPLTLSYDHRIVDGADAARFMVDLVKELEGLQESVVKV